MALSIHNERITIEAGKMEMEGALRLPEKPIGMVLFANGGVGNRVRSFNDYVASVLRNARLGTLWLDLLTVDEARCPVVFDAVLLAQRVGAACDYLRQYGATSDMPVGLFSINHSAGAVLHLGAMRRRGIAAIVLRGGCPDLASHALLCKISAPTLLIAGGLDDTALTSNRSAYAALRCKKRFEIIPGGTQAFDEPGSLEVVARLARGWFLQHANFAHG